MGSEPGSFGSVDEVLITMTTPSYLTHECINTRSKQNPISLRRKSSLDNMTNSNKIGQVSEQKESVAS